METNSAYEGFYYLKTDAIVEGKLGSTMKLLIANIFANPNQVTFSNTSIMLSV